MSFDVEKVLGGVTLTPAEADGLLEVAYLSGVANGSLSRDELRSFRRLAHALVAHTEGGGEVPTLETLLDRFEARSEGVEPSIRLAALAKVLSRDAARRAAYKAAYALSISDLESNEHEEELEADLATALGLHDEVQALREEVLGAVDGET